MTDAQNLRGFEDVDVLRWAERHGLDVGTFTDMKCAFEDAFSLGELGAHPAPQRDEHITRMLDQLSVGVGTFLQGDGEKLVEYVRGLEQQIDSLRRERDAARDNFVNLDDYIQGCLV